MRKRITILLGIGLTFVLAFGVIGSGAFFTTSAGASQTLTVGQMTLEINSGTPGAYFDGATLVCPPFTVVTSSGPGTTGGTGPACDISVKSTGSISPSQVNVIMTATTNGTHLARYGLFPTGFPVGPGHTEGAFFILKTTPQTVGHWFGFELPGLVHLPLDWGLTVGNAELDNADMGTTVHVSYSFEAQQ
jgi:hypothetical protein